MPQKGLEGTRRSGLTFRDLTHPDDLTIDVRLVLQALADEIGSFRITKRYLDADGTQSVRDRHGTFSAALAYHDVTDLVRAIKVKDEFVTTVSHELRTPLTSHLPESLETMADGMRLRQVVDNVIANAILYGRPDGHVSVTLAESDGHVVLTVADDGEGIDESDLPGMFQRFFRGQNAHRRQVPGTGLGLGLSIVRMIVEAHGGEVSIDSRAGVGSTVRLTLPRRSSGFASIPARA